MKSYINMNSTVISLGANYLVHTGYLYTISRLKVCIVSKDIILLYSPSFDLPSLPILTINNLSNKDFVINLLEYY